MSLYDPRNRKEIYYRGILDGDNSLPDPQTREEIFLKAIAEAMPIITEATVVQEKGTSATDVMSQKAVTDAIDELGITVVKNIASADNVTTGEYWASPDTTGSASGYQRIEIPVIEGRTYSLWKFQKIFSFMTDSEGTNYGSPDPGNVTIPTGCTLLHLSYNFDNVDFSSVFNLIIKST